MVLPEGEYKSAVATVEKAKLFTKERIAELSKPGGKLDRDDGEKRAATSLLLSRHWTHAKKGSLKEFLTADAKELADPADARDWFLKTYKK